MNSLLIIILKKQRWSLFTHFYFKILSFLCSIKINEILYLFHKNSLFFLFHKIPLFEIWKRRSKLRVVYENPNFSTQSSRYRRSPLFPLLSQTSHNRTSMTTHHRQKPAPTYRRWSHTIQPHKLSHSPQSTSVKEPIPLHFPLLTSHMWYKDTSPLSVLFIFFTNWKGNQEDNPTSFTRWEPMSNTTIKPPPGPGLLFVPVFTRLGVWFC